MLDYSLYLVTDRGLSLGRSTLEIVQAAVAGGVSCVQLRENHCSTREFLNEAHSLQEFLHSKNIPLIINDRVDVALAIGADGVHLGQKDMPIGDARKLLGNKIIIGISAESVDDAVFAEAQGADYVGISPVFTTTTKKDIAPPLGLEGIREIRRKVRLPLLAIGGIHQDNATAVLQAGADGIAVVSAIVSAQCPATAAKVLREKINQNRK